MSNANNVKRPSLFWLLTEGGRAATELGLSFTFRKLHRNKMTGDGHPVLVLPGFLATDSSTKQLRKFIDELGYDSHAWGMGRNYAKVKFLKKLSEKIDDIAAETGEKITIIGWSLGGVYARQLAKAKPHLVRQVITLGSPFRGISEPNNVAWIYNLINGFKRASDIDNELLKDLPLPAPVPTTAIYSKEDGVVPWELCMEEVEDCTHQNIQVRGSHLGLGVNLSVLEIIADRLKYTQSDWVPFTPQSAIKDLLFYPSL